MSHGYQIINQGFKKVLFCPKLIVYGAKQAVFPCKAEVDKAIKQGAMEFRYELFSKDGKSYGTYQLPMSQIVLQPQEYSDGKELQYKISYSLAKTNPIVVSPTGPVKAKDIEQRFNGFVTKVKEVLTGLNEELKTLKERVAQLEKK